MSIPQSSDQAVRFLRRVATPSISQERLREASAALDHIEAEVIHLYQEAAPSLFRYAVSLVRQTETAQDALQECFLRYYAARVSGKMIRSGRAWLFKVLRNYLLDQLRMNSERVVVSIEEAKDVPAQSRNPEASCESAEIRAMFGVHLAPRELECLRLRAEGLRYREIAEILRIESGTVGAMLARAFRKLREATGSRGARP